MGFVVGRAQVFEVGDHGVVAEAQIVGHLHERAVGVGPGQRARPAMGAIPQVQSRDPRDTVHGLALEHGKHPLLVSHGVTAQRGG